MDNIEIAERLVKIAKEMQAKLIEDYGIADNLIDLVEPQMSEIIDLYEDGQYEEIAEIEDRKEGKLLDLADTKDLDEYQKAALEDFSYLVMFVSVKRPDKWTLCSYLPKKKMLRIVYYTSLPFSLYKMDLFGATTKDQLLKDMRRYDLSIQHEVTHAVRDAMTGHIEEVVKSFSDDEILEHYKERGHLEYEFEIDAIINAIARLKNRTDEEKWEEMTPERLEYYMHGLKLPSKNDPMWRDWIKRLNREDLLSEAMKENWNV